MTERTLQQWLERLEKIHWTEIDLGLERVQSVAGRMDLLPAPCPVVTIAGTNGKGSTAAVLESLLQSCGYRCGVFTSPHLIRFNERIRLDGREADDTELIAAFDAIDRARDDISLTYFEFATLAALWLFRATPLDFIVLEVGLGGRLDAVNIVDAQVAVVTSIDLDHQSWLGDSRAAIAKEKAGIFRSGSAAVIADPSPPAQLLAQADTLGVRPLLCAGRDYHVGPAGDGWQAVLQGVAGGTRSVAAQETGSLLPDNIAAAMQVALLLGIDFSDAQLAQAVRAAAPLGRRQALSWRDRHYVLDVAHNPAAVNKLLEYLSITSCKGRTYSLFSCMADKDVGAMVSLAAPHFDAWFVADQKSNARAASASAVAALLRREGQTVISVSKNITQALRRAQSVMSATDRLVIFGSFFTVAGALTVLSKDGYSPGTGVSL